MGARRSLSTPSPGTASQNLSEFRRRSALAMEGPGHVVPDALNNKSGAPPSSFATLTMAPSLVAK